MKSRLPAYVAHLFFFLANFIALHSQAQSNTWVQKSDFGFNAPNVTEPTGWEIAVSFSIGSKGYIGTGYGDNGYRKDLWEYDPDANAWTQKADFGGAARYGV